MMQADAGGGNQEGSVGICETIMLRTSVISRVTIVWCEMKQPLFLETADDFVRRG